MLERAEGRGVYHGFQSTLVGCLSVQGESLTICLYPSAQEV